MIIYLLNDIFHPYIFCVRGDARRNIMSEREVHIWGYKVMISEKKRQETNESYFQIGTSKDQCILSTHLTLLKSTVPEFLGFTGWCVSCGNENLGLTVKDEHPCRSPDSLENVWNACSQPALSCPTLCFSIGTSTCVSHRLWPMWTISNMHHVNIVGHNKWSSLVFQYGRKNGFVELIKWFTSVRKQFPLWDRVAPF